LSSQVTHLLLATDFAHARIVPDQLQWDPLPLPPAPGCHIPVPSITNRVSNVTN